MGFSLWLTPVAKFLLQLIRLKRVLTQCYKELEGNQNKPYDRLLCGRRYTGLAA